MSQAPRMTQEEWLESLRPPDTQWNVLSLGAGVQSSCLALMAAKGEITPMPDYAIFADTQSEPQSVYDWLDWLEQNVPFPICRVTAGDLEKKSLNPSTRVSAGKNGGVAGDKYMRQIIPLFGLLPNGKKTAAIGRKCTADYKIGPIMKQMKNTCGIKRAQKEATVTQWIGISWDELQRMKDSARPWVNNRWPLIEKRMRRQDCLDWMKANGYPEPPRSACYYCPFHSDTEWRRMRDEEPEYFQRAIDFDEKIRRQYKKYDKAMKMEVYLHNSCRPLREIDFDTDTDRGQGEWDFMSECEGMCGV